ncbi:MAG: SDR family oxidoreductase [Lachnospiraceae bacterium]|nr:SDR family oxidoreductase [Lachnospiraceae bacterium]
MLKGKNAIITGARRGIGRATVETFAAQGADIWACARKQDDVFEADMKSLAERYNVDIRPVYFDVTDETQVRKTMQSIHKQKKDVDILVSAAGVAGEKTSFLMSSMENIKSVFETDYMAVTLLTQYVVRLMIRQNRGSIVYISSIAGLDGTPSQYAYASAKAALIGGMKNLAREVAGNNIRVNAVAPGMINTDMGGEIQDDLKEEMLSKVIMKRMGRPEEVANVIAFISSDMASYMTGQVIRVDGGV